MARWVELRHESLGLGVGPSYCDFLPVAAHTQLADPSHTPTDRHRSSLGLAGYFVDSKRPDGGVTGVTAGGVTLSEKQTAVHSPGERWSQVRGVFQHFRRTTTSVHCFKSVSIVHRRIEKGWPKTLDESYALSVR